MTRRPTVLIPADSRMIGAHPFQAVGEKYIQAVARGAGCLPLLLPGLGDGINPLELLDLADGLFFPGSPSNVHPSLYGDGNAAATPPFDPARDATTLPLLRAALDRNVPILAVCRGHQELNVALGGTLHPRVQDVPGLADHREPHEAPLEIQYGKAHPVRLAPGGLLARITGLTEFPVNSLHQQGIDLLAPGLTAEAWAPDGLVEAVRAPAAGFVVGVQWHPEWRFWEDAPSQALLAAFGAAVRAGRSNTKGQKL